MFGLEEEIAVFVAGATALAAAVRVAAKDFITAAVAAGASVIALLIASFEAVK